MSIIVCGRRVPTYEWYTLRDVPAVEARASSSAPILLSSNVKKSLEKKKWRPGLEAWRPVGQCTLV